MQKWMRNTHLLIGLFSLPFLLTYAVSSVQMAHRNWFKQRPNIEKTEVDLPALEATDGRALAHALMTRAVVRGEISRIDSTPKGYKVRIVRPGTVADVTYDRETAKAAVQTTTSDTLFMLNRLHHQAGVHHEYWLLNVWGWALAVTGVLLVGLAATGIYLWFKMHGELVIGLILLALSLSYSLTLIYSIRVA